MTNILQHRGRISGFRPRGGVLVLAAAVAMVLMTPCAQAQTFVVLHSFTGADGANPYADLTRDAAGNLYGTTYQGGAYNYGVVFEVDTTGKETVLHSFTGGDDGIYPVAGLVRDNAGNLYGSAVNGGHYGHGVVFKLTPSGTLTVLHSFTGGLDGWGPSAGLLAGAGNLYGTTVDGGGALGGGGVVFELTLSGMETELHSFAGQPTDGACPSQGLVRDNVGNLYGTTECGGASGYGTVFKLDTTGRESVLHNFAGSSTDGEYPQGGYLVRDSAGNLYGTTPAGGMGLGCNGGCGIVFAVSATGREFILHSFTDGADGANPYGGLVGDSMGNFYGTASGGGTYGYGVVFKMDRKGNETVLYSFTGGTDGKTPYLGLIRDAAGNLYGTTYSGGDLDAGVVFKVTP